MATILNRLHTHPTLLSALRFAVVGVLGTLLDFTLFSAGHLLLHLPALIANTCSYSAGIINNYFLHRGWTFAPRPQKSAVRQFASFAAISLCALLVNNLVVTLLAPSLAAYLPDRDQAVLLAKICATGVGMVWNFLANHFWTFRA